MPGGSASALIASIDHAPIATVITDALQPDKGRGALIGGHAATAWLYVGAVI